MLPYINADSSFCTTRADCVSSLAQAEDLFGVKLNYHHDTFETVFITNLTQQFCGDWELATNNLSSFENCGFVHGPTADDYIAWQISVDEALLYVPKEKERVGWRPWTTSWTPHDPDLRNCSVYKETEQESHRQSISQCGLILESPETCQGTSGCSWRPIFHSGKCIITPRIDFPWQEVFPNRSSTCEALQSTTTTTVSQSSTTTVSTVTNSATVSGTSMTHTSTSGSATHTSTSITATHTETSTGTATGSVTSMTQTSTTVSATHTSTRVSATHTSTSVTATHTDTSTKTATVSRTTSSTASSSTQTFTATSTTTITSSLLCKRVVKFVRQMPLNG